MAEEKRQPLSFWGTVGAVAVSSVLTGGLFYGLGVLFVGAVAGKAASRALEGAGLPPNGLPGAGGAGRGTP